MSRDARRTAAAFAAALAIVPLAPSGGAAGDAVGATAPTSSSALHGRPDTVIVTPERAGLNGIAFSPDGERIASSALDGRIYLWDAATGEQLLALDAHRDEAYAVAFSPDGRWLATGGEDGKVRIWSAETVELERSLEADPWPMELAFGPDGEELAVAEIDGDIVIHPLAGGAADTLISVDGGGVDVAWSPAGAPLAASFAGGGAPVLMQDPGDDGSRQALRGHGHVVMDLAFTPDGTHLLSGSADASIRVWNLETGAAVDTLATRMPAPFFALSPDGRQLAAGGAGRVVRLWSMDDLGGEDRVLARHDLSVTAVAFSPCGDRVASAGLDGRVRIVRLEGGGGCP